MVPSLILNPVEHLRRQLISSNFSLKRVAKQRNLQLRVRSTNELLRLIFVQYSEKLESSLFGNAILHGSLVGVARPLINASAYGLFPAGLHKSLRGEPSEVVHLRQLWDDPDSDAD
jgi:hypothetical protein